MNKKITLFFAILISFFSTKILAQEYTGVRANEIINGADLVRFTEYSTIPEYVRFKQGKEIPLSEMSLFIRKVFFENDKSVTFKTIKSEKDALQFEHIRYQQYYNNVPIEWAVLIVHSKDNKVVSFNGRLADLSTADYTASLSESVALHAALQHINAEVYKWQVPSEERFVKENFGIDSYYPKGELVWFAPEGHFNKGLRKVWKFNVYAHKPLSRNEVYIDAQDGSVLFLSNKIQDANSTGTAVTGYSGTRTIITDSYNGSYRLRETTRGNGVQTFNLNKGTDYGNATDFTDADNNWNNVNADLDQYATDAHWGLEMTYDYFLNVHNRNSIDNNGMLLQAYIHYDIDYFNAFWDGQVMTFGDGDNNNPLVSLDICGHELSHGITENTAGLIYQNESGALNESFSDIFGTTIEFYTKPTTGNWLMGDEIGSAFRNMSDPNANGDPDTYNGTNWYTGTQDNGGVHTNSGVQNFWYYLLCQGGSGTNDIGNAYNVTGIGMDDARQIAYRSLTNYLGATSNYADARFYSIQAAIDIFGPCTPQVISTTNAWYAVGVGAAFNASVIADFSTPITSSCAFPFTVNFTNSSTNGGSFTWDFGDGTNSTASNPSHTYTAYGDYTVTLTADGGTCGSDIEVKTNYISVNAANPCIAIMGTGNTQSSCAGTMYDNGGAIGNYTDNSDLTMTISPPGATSVNVTFTSFNFETDWDYVYIYDGPTTASPLIGQYTGSNLPNGGNAISSTTGSITIRQSSDVYINSSGFMLNWTCVIPNSPPIVNFVASETSSCSGTITFTDQSNPLPTAWLWDFGDGTTSTQQNPTHTYANDGNYTVTLTSTNNYGSNSLIKSQYINVDKPDAPIAQVAYLCGPGSAVLSAIPQSGGILNWYDNLTGGTNLGTGNTYNTPVINNTTSYYVEEVLAPTSQYVGPTTNTIGNGGAFNGTQSLIFDAISNFTLVSVQVYATGAGNRTIELRNSSGTVIQSATVNIPNGSSRITLNFSVPAGTGYQLGATANANLYRNNSGVNYPYTLNGIVSITGSTAGSAYYYSFYDWEILTQACYSPRTEVIANIISAPTTVDASRCGSGTVTLTASGSSDILWYDAPTGGNLVNTGSTFSTPILNNTTVYYVESHINNPSQYVGPADNNFGSGANFTGNQHLKFDCFSDFQLLSVKVYANGAGNRTVELRNSSGTVLQSATINIPDGESRINLNFNISPGTQYQLAINGTTNLYRNSAGAVYPYTLPGVVSITGTSASTGGYYYFFYDWEIIQPGCSTTRTPATATINPNPSVTVPPTQNICSGSSVTLNATNVVGDLLWMPGGSNSSSIVVSPTSTQTYTVTATNSCGSISESVTVNVTPQPSVTAPQDQNICSGDPVTLTAYNVNGNLVWTPGNQTNASITVSPTQTTTYLVTATNSCGSVSDSVTVNINQALTVDAGPDVNICSGQSATLNVSGSGSFVWSTGQTGSTINVNPTSSQAYFVTATGSCGSATDTVMVNVNPLPTVTAPLMQSICIGSSATLTASNYVGSLNWTPVNVSGETINVSPVQNTVYTVIASNSCGTYSDTVSVIVNMLPTINAGPDITICLGQTAVINASTNDGNLLWSTGDTTGSISVSPNNTQTYYVSVSGLCGTAADTVEIFVNIPAIPTITQNGNTLSSSSAVSYQWYFNGVAIANANNQSFTPQQDGIYAVEIIDSNGCSAMSTDYQFIVTGLNDLSVDFKLYPNPNNGNFVVVCNQHIKELSIYNALGQLIKQISNNHNSNQFEINVSEQSNGIYFIQFQTNEQSIIRKFSINK